MINYGTCTVCGWSTQNRDCKGRCPNCQDKEPDWRIPNENNTLSGPKQSSSYYERLKRKEILDDIEYD